MVHKYPYLFLSTLAIAAVGAFAYWWFNPAHIPHNFDGYFRILDVLLFLLVSYIIWHPVAMEVLMWCISSNIKDIDRRAPLPGLKVAFITTIVPKNEPIELLHKCLPAMINADYEHDTWILDEGDSEEVKKICKQYGVKHFSRFGKTHLNTQIGKYTKTKGGNHNSWYDTYGNEYDFVAQIDTDFVPKHNFLTKTLGYFRDPNVAFVGTPQVYGNTNHSLIALGANEQQFSFYGAVLRGLSGMGMTLLIGANHIIRVAAFKGVGHYTAHITEDLVTGMKLHAHGWKSVYVPYALAIGEGPATWESYFNQQLRWAYGCIDILFRHSFKYFRMMNFRQAIYYFLLQQHYFSGFAMALSILLLSLYFLFGLRAADVDIFTFLIFYSFILITCWLMSVWLQQFDIDRKQEGELYLAGKIISIAAWPIWFLAFINILTGKRLVYKVTPKGEDDSQITTSPMVFLPHFVFAGIAIVGLLSSLFTERQSPIMLFWAFSSIVLMITIPFVYDVSRMISKVRLGLYSFMQKRYVSAKSLHFTRNPSLTTSQIDVVIDCFFLCTIVVISSALYIGKIGFYSDDWSFLGNFSVSDNQSLLGLYQTATTPNTFMRPVQNLYDAFLFWLFGAQPLGYQLINAVIFLTIILLFYFILRQLKVPRIITVAAPLVYALLPHYATDRFWYAGFQINLSILFFLVSTYTGLKALSLHATKKLLLKIVSVFSLIISGLSYEITLPLVFLNVILFSSPRERFLVYIKSRKFPVQNHSVFIVVNLLILFYLILFKFKTTTRLGGFNYPGDAGHLIMSIFDTNYGFWGIQQPYILGEILTKYASPMLLVLGFILFIIIFFYLYAIISKPDSYFPSTRWMRNVTFLGFCIFILGYAIFVTNNKVGFSPTGIDNRVAIAAAIGIAFTVVGGVGWISRILLPERFAKWLFCVTISVICTGGFLIINTLASFWIAAYEQGQLVLSDIRKSFPTVTKNSTIILDGVCPYIGPGIVFESQWDLKGALQTMYHESAINADIVTPRLMVTRNGIVTQIYTFRSLYPYKDLYIYNFKNKEKYSIMNADDANAYFKKFNPDRNNGCPPSSAGNGVTVF